MNGEPTGASKWLIVFGMVMLLLAAVALIMFVIPTPSWLNSESAFMIPIGLVVFTVLGLASMIAGLLVSRASAKRQPRV